MTGEISASELLDVWERGVSATLLERALLILSANRPDESWEALARLSIGERDALLLRLREKTFGPRIEALCDCPYCGETVEASFAVSDVLVGPSPGDEEPFELTLDGYDVRFRLPDSNDLAAVISLNNKTLAARQLFKRCVVEARQGNMPVTVERLPSALAKAVADRIARTDSQSNMELELSCPVCERSWVSLFDIGAFFWSEISAWARRLLRDVHRLASAYGWSERAILDMSAQRRQAYLEMTPL